MTINLDDLSNDVNDSWNCVINTKTLYFFKINITFLGDNINHNYTTPTHTVNNRYQRGVVK